MPLEGLPAIKEWVMAVPLLTMMNQARSSKAVALAKRRALAQQISGLSSTEHREILKILTGQGVGCTHNSNGAFVNLAALPEDVIDDIQRFTDFCVSNKKELDEYERRISECKIYNNYSTLVSRAGAGAGEDGEQGCGGEPSGTTADPPADDWNAVIRTVAKTDAQKEHVSKYVDALMRTQQHMDAKLVRKTASHNKFAMVKKRYSRRATRSTDHHDLPDCLSPE